VIPERGAQYVTVTDQVMKTCNRTVLRRFYDLKLRAVPGVHG
jgi:hypothetical protein